MRFVKPRNKSFTSIYNLHTSNIAIYYSRKLLEMHLKNIISFQTEIVSNLIFLKNRLFMFSWLALLQKVSLFNRKLVRNASIFFKVCEGLLF